MVRMEQMTARDAPVLEKVDHATIQAAFVRDRDGKIFYAARRGGCADVYDFPVHADGRVSPTAPGSCSFYPGEQVDVIHHGSLGIKRIVWYEDPMQEKRL